MPLLARPDGVEIHWESRGDGPLVVLALACMSSPSVFEDVIDALADSHRVVTYDPRGTGASTRRGPYGRARDEADLEALLEELADPAVVVCTGDGCHRAVRVGARRPDLVRAVVTPGGNPLGRMAAEGTEALSASDSVIDMLVQTMRTDYRAALRIAIGSANPQLDEEGLRRRVDEMCEYADQETTLERLLDWIDDSAVEETRALGGRFWMLQHSNNPWFHSQTAERSKLALPEARIEFVEDGPLTRPDITVDYVRRIVSG